MAIVPTVSRSGFLTVLISMLTGNETECVKSIHRMAIKYKFIGKPLKILTFHTKNTPVHWGKIHPIKQEYSLVRRKKFIGMKTEFYTYQSHFHCIGQPKEKAENLLRRNQKLATSLDFNWSCSLSAIRAMNSEFVGFPLVLETVYPKNLCRVSRSPLSQATSMAWRMARSTLDGVVWKVFATWGYSTFVMAFVSLAGHAEATTARLGNPTKNECECWWFVAFFIVPFATALRVWKYDSENQLYSQAWTQWIFEII